MRDALHSCAAQNRRRGGLQDGRREGWLVFDFGRCNGTELFAAYQELGLLCSSKGRPGSVMLKTGTEDADVHYTLRDVLLTVACIVDSRPLDLRLALVASSVPIARVGCAMRQELSILGCDLRVFGSESKAASWLRGRISPRRAPATLEVYA